MKVTVERRKRRTRKKSTKERNIEAKMVTNIRDRRLQIII